MILSQTQQAKYIYWLLFAIITLLAILTISCSIKFGLIQSKGDWFALLVILGIITFSVHQFLLWSLTRLSLINQKRQEILGFSAMLVYLHINNHKYTLEKSGSDHQYNVHANLSPNETRKRILFCLHTIIHDQKAILSKDIKDNYQREWDYSLSNEIGVSEREQLWQTESKEITPLVKTHYELVRKITNEIKKDSSIQRLKNILDSLKF